jgi:hypothetical protein
MKEYCPRCDAKLEWRGEHQFCVPCNFWWSWTGSSWMGRKNTEVSSDDRNKDG